MKDNLRTLRNLKSYPERIVSLSPSNTEILFALGAREKVVGITDYCNYPPDLKARIEADKITRVGGYWNPSLELIVGLKPDLVLVSTAKCMVKKNQCKMDCRRRCEITSEVASQLKSLGLNVLALAPHSMDEVLDNILLVGMVCGNDFEAVNLVNNLKERIDRVVGKTRARALTCFRPKVYFEIWNSPYMSVSSRTWIGDLIKLAGGTNIFGEAVSEWPVISLKEIVYQNPDIIVFPVVPDLPPFWGSFKEVKKREGWKGINAVRNGRLYEVSRDLISRPGPRLVEALEMISKIIQLGQ